MGLSNWFLQASMKEQTVTGPKYIIVSQAENETKLDGVTDILEDRPEIYSTK